MDVRCSCGKGSLEKRAIDRRDVGEVLGFDPGDVVIENFLGLVCNGCGEVTLPGEVLDAIAARVTRIILERGERLRPREVSFLRGELGMTQAELAERLGVSRATVARWESEDGKVGRLESLALRSLVASLRGETKLLKEIDAPKRAETHTELPYRVEAPSL
jgi:DNA-binding transcriptional regulator YiaG